MTQDSNTGQQGNTQGQPQQLPEPSWYRNPPSWWNTPPQSHAPQNNAGSTGNSDLTTAINALPERVVNALRDAINAAQNNSAAQNAGQQNTGQQNAGQQNNDQNTGQQNTGQQSDDNRPGPQTFAEKWFGGSL